MAELLQQLVTRRAELRPDATALAPKHHQIRGELPLPPQRHLSLARL